MVSGIITLTTDFGIRDAYVGAMKGVILGINPNARMVDISHEIEPQNILQAAYVVNSAAPYFPADSVHLAVVDPGVGSGRKAIINWAKKAFFIGPDNGVFSYLINNTDKAVEITNPDYFLQPVSNTFHGRDIFAPVAAHLSLGVPVQEFGEEVTGLVTLPGSQPSVMPDGTVVGNLIYIDRFGNLITNITIDYLPREGITIEIKGHSISGVSTSYTEGKDLLALIGSDGFLEIAMRNGSVAQSLQCSLGDAVKVGSGSIKT